jgi:GNAT superfamily N-acetyltransferase
MALTIRPAIPSDAPTIVEFNCRLAEETENKVLEPEVVRRGVAAVLADPHKGLYFMAVDNGETVGQLCITYEFSDWRNGWLWWIQSVYVRAAARRRGVFRALYAYLYEKARREPDVIGLRLYVEHENAAARQTYLDLGMIPAPYQFLERFPL